MPDLIVDEETRNAAFTAYAREYADITGSTDYVAKLLGLRERGLAQEDRTQAVDHVMRLVDTRNNDAADAFEDLRQALLSHNITMVKSAVLAVCRAFGDENLGLVVRFELQGAADGTLGCLNDARGWALVYNLMRELISIGDFYLVEAAVSHVMNRLPRSVMEMMTETQRITIAPLE